MMKRIIIISCFHFFILLSVESFSQNLSFGFKGGLDLTTLYSPKSNFSSPNLVLAQAENQLNFQMGFVCKAQITELTGLIIEPGFIQKGTSYASHFAGSRLGYINLPLLFTYSPLSKFNIEIGPEVGYRLYNKTTNQTDPNVPPISIELNNNFDFSAIVGISYNITEKFNIGSRYSYGLTKMELVSPMSNQHIYFSNRYVEVFVRYYLFKV